MSASSSADFLRIVSHLGLAPAERRRLAPMLGFDPPPANAWDDQARPRAAPEHIDVSDRGAKAPGVGSSATRYPRVPFFRTERVAYHDPSPGERQPPPTAEKPFAAAELAPLARLDLPATPVHCEWPKLWPRVFELVAEERRGMQVDAAALVAAVTRLQPIRTIPRVRRRYWPEQLTVVRDRATYLVPIWNDQADLTAHLKRVLGPGRVQVVDINTPWASVERPSSGPCLALTDLGTFGSPADRARWARQAFLRGLRGQPLRALVPVPPALLKNRASRWQRYSWSAPHTWMPDPHSSARQRRATALLALLAPASRVEVGLLRALRQRLGLAVGDLVTELDAWRLPHLRASRSAAAGWSKAHVQSLREQYAQAERIEEKALAVKLLKAWHGHAFARDLWPEEQATIRELISDAPAALREAIETALQEVADPVDPFAERILATLRGGDPAAQRKVLAYLRGLVRRAPDGFFDRQGAARMRSDAGVNPYFEALKVASTLEGDAGPLGRGVRPEDLADAAPGPERKVTWRHGAEGLSLSDRGSPVATGIAQSRSFAIEHAEVVQRRPFEVHRPVAFTPGGLLVRSRVDWAERWGLDVFGLWAEASIEGVAFRMRWIEPGTFMMGSPDDEAGRSNRERPQHEVTISAGFWMAETPCTQALYEVVTGANPSHFKGADRPVERVSWAEAQTFLAEINALRPNLGLRLPTEAEWEFACRSGTTGPTYAPSVEGGAPGLDAIAWYVRNGGGETHPVGQKRPNPWGLFDTVGHVYEWCWDAPRAYTTAPELDPVGTGSLRVLRGGSWGSGARFVRAASRDALAPSRAFGYFGFRLSRGQAAPGDPEGPEEGAEPPTVDRGAVESDPRQPPDRSSPELLIKTDRSELALGIVERPTWADRMGRDPFGLFVDVSVPAKRRSRIDVQFRLRWIAPGRFRMGSPETEAGRRAGETQHLVTLTEGFWLADTPCTQDQWAAVMTENPSWFISPDRPVETVSFVDVEAFLARLTELKPLFAPILPTEAQWEYACRAGTEAATYAGDLVIAGARNAPVLDAIAWYGGNSGAGFELQEGFDSTAWDEKQYPHHKAGTRVVRSKQPNPWGLFDMLGNVYEWCRDRTDLSDYGSESRTDPIGSGGTERVLRGGSWGSAARVVRAASRVARDPSLAFVSIGFRLSRGQAAPSWGPEGQPGFGAEPRSARVRGADRARADGPAEAPESGSPSKESPGLLKWVRRVLTGKETDPK